MPLTSSVPPQKHNLFVLGFSCASLGMVMTCIDLRQLRQVSQKPPEVSQLRRDGVRRRRRYIQVATERKGDCYQPSCSPPPRLFASRRLVRSGALWWRGRVPLGPELLFLGAGFSFGHGFLWFAGSCVTTDSPHWVASSPPIGRCHVSGRFFTSFSNSQDMSFLHAASQIPPVQGLLLRVLTAAQTLLAACPRGSTTSVAKERKMVSSGQRKSSNKRPGGSNKASPPRKTHNMIDFCLNRSRYMCSTPALIAAPFTSRPGCALG